MTHQLILKFMIRQTHIATLAHVHVIARFAGLIIRKSSPIQKQNNLFFILQCFINSRHQLRRKTALHALPSLLFFGVGHNEFRHLHVAKSLFHFHPSKLLFLAVMQSFHGRCGSAQNHFAVKHLRQHNRTIARMIARSGCHLFQRAVVLFVHNH